MINAITESTTDLLAEHDRLLRQHGADSIPVYEFEMRHLNNAEFLQRAAEAKRRHIQWRQDRWLYLWFWVVISVLATFQAVSIFLMVYGHLR
jgi:hypothetical protein